MTVLLTAAADLGVPEYRVAEDGPDHLKEFTATAVVAGQERGSGQGRTKKEAEQRAAEHAGEHRHAHGVPHLRAGAERHHERYHTHDERERRHDDRPQPLPARQHRGLEARHPLTLQLPGGLDD